MAVFAGSVCVQTWGPLQFTYNNCVFKERERKHCILNAVQVALAELEGQINRDKKCNGVV